MGYPMTWLRVIRRNGMERGDYERAGWKWQANVNTQPLVDPRAHADILEVRRERIQQYENAARLLFGDLRRLELDALDENSICHWIADRTVVAPDVVAHVLKEFFAL